MESTLYLLTAFTTLICSLLLLRGYVKVRKRLLLWSGLCFAALTVENLLIFGDIVLLPTVDLYTYRQGSAVVGMCLLLYGLIWESQ
jgi:hypothetical protein